MYIFNLTYSSIYCKNIKSHIVIEDVNKDSRVSVVFIVYFYHFYTVLILDAVYWLHFGNCGLFNSHHF